MSIAEEKPYENPLMAGMINTAGINMGTNEAASMNSRESSAFNILLNTEVSSDVCNISSSWPDKKRRAVSDIKT